MRLDKRRNFARKFVPSAVWAAAIAVGLASCAATPADNSKEDDLAAAGFVARPASTPQRQAMLQRLPPNRFLERVGATP